MDIERKGSVEREKERNEEECIKSIKCMLWYVTEPEVASLLSLG